jgi:hypothetical protein
MGQLMFNSRNSMLDRSVEAGMIGSHGLGAREERWAGEDWTDEDWTDSGSWANVEFGDAELGDARRTQRLVQLARDLGARPSASLPDATEDWAELKAAYRFFDSSFIEKVAVLQSHVEAAYERMRRVPLVLGVQDTTLLDFTSHPATTGLGPLASAYQHGLLAHSTLAFTPERVLVLSVFRWVFWRKRSGNETKKNVDNW